MTTAVSQSRRRSLPHRNPTSRLDPYTIRDTTITLAEWRRCRANAAPIHIVLRQDDTGQAVA